SVGAELFGKRLSGGNAAELRGKVRREGRHFLPGTPFTHKIDDRQDPRFDLLAHKRPIAGSDSPPSIPTMASLLLCTRTGVIPPHRSTGVPCRSAPNRP